MSTRAQILAEIAAQFPDNTTGLITPAKLRQVVEDIANSYNNLTDEPAVPASRTVNGHALSSNVTVTAADVGLGSVENTALSTWAGSTNLATVGTITAGTWHGSAIADTYISSAAAWNAKVSFPGFGTTAGTAAEGNDARLSDARTPLAHNQAWSTITSTPTTLSGYGITDAQGLDSDLTALAGLSTTGIVARTADGAAATRTITGTADQVVVTNGDGVSGNPTLSLPQSIATTSTPQFARLGIGVSPSAARLEIDSGTGQRPSPISNTGIRMSAPDSIQNSIESCGWGAAPLRIVGRRAGGTRADPTAVAGGSSLLNLEGTGYDGTTHQSSPAAAIRLLTNGDWSETNRGTQITLLGTPLDSTTLATWATLVNGKVGIGTTSPAAQLHTTGTVRFAGFGAGTLVTDSSGNVTTRTITGTADQVIVTNGDGAAGNPTLSLPQSIAKTSTPQFSRIGIGSASLSTAGIYLTSADTGGSSVYGIYAAPNVKKDVTTRYSAVTTAPSTQAETFTLATLYHFFATQGTFGEGSTVEEQSGFVVSSSLTGATNNYGFRSAIPAGTGRWNLYMDGTAVNYLAGNLGIGTTSPSAQLHTTGTVRFAGVGAGSLETDSYGNVTASSDARLKNVTGDFSRGLADVLKLTPRTYHWNEKSGMNTEDENVGFIAQEVQDAIPEAVGTMKTTDYEEDDAATGKKVRKSKREAAEYLTLSDRPIIAALVNAVKELKAENDTLRARVSALENGKAAK